MTPAAEHESAEPCILCAERTTRKLFEKGGRDFLRCVSCGLVRVAPLPSVEELQTHYAASYDDGAYDAFSRAASIRGAIADDRLHAVLRHVPSEGRWLDVGCSSGDFLDAADRAGIRAEGIDLAAGAVERARARGFVARQASVESFEPDAAFDVITAFDVLEHSRQPLAMLGRLRSWLRPGGHLILAVPDVGSILPRFVMRRHWFYYAPQEHLYYFDERTLERSLGTAGLQVASIRPASKPLSLRYSAENLRVFNPRLGAAACAAIRLLPRGLGERLWHLRIGELFAVASRP